MDFKKQLVFCVVFLLVFSASAPVFPVQAKRIQTGSLIRSGQDWNAPGMVNEFAPTFSTRPGAASNEVSTQVGKTYYLSPTGSDSNSGTSAAAPWLTPNHALNCGDSILAAPGTNYNANNFGSDKWGKVSCASGNNVAWLKCATFGACKINTNANDAMRVSASYWGVQGWEATNTTGACFTASPAISSATIHHIIFANNIANGCKNNGVNSYPYSGSKGPAGVDYLAVIGNLIYNAASGNNQCFSGISIYEPRNYDTKPGTHIYIAQNISWSNVDGASCPGNSDGNGIILDDWNGDQSGFATSYTGQGVVENNLTLGNGSAGVESFHNTASPVIIQNNTAYANYTDPHHIGSYKGEILISWSANVTAKYNIGSSAYAASGADNFPVYAFYIGKSTASNQVDYLWAYSKFGENISINNSPGFAFGSHLTLGVDPKFANPSVPGAPACQGKANTLDCMKGTLANFFPKASGIARYGYQPVTSVYVLNDHFPAWLCGVALPGGILSNYCVSPSSGGPPDPSQLTSTAYIPLVVQSGTRP